MKKSKWTEEKIIGILKELEAGIPAKDLCRKYGVRNYILEYTGTGIVRFALL